MRGLLDHVAGPFAASPGVNLSLARACKRAQRRLVAEVDAVFAKLAPDARAEWCTPLFPRATPNDFAARSRRCSSKQAHRSKSSRSSCATRRPRWSTGVPSAAHGSGLGGLSRRRRVRSFRVGTVPAQGFERCPSRSRKPTAGCGLGGHRWELVYERSSRAGPSGSVLFRETEQRRGNLTATTRPPAIRAVS
jgi:hypothetical protein